MSTTKDDLARKIGKKVRELRKRSGWTQRRLAEATELSPGLLSRIENGLTMPSIPTLQLVANTLKTQIGYFFQEDEGTNYIVTYPGRRRIVVSRTGPKGALAYELELLAEGMKNPFMEPAIVTYVGKEGEVEDRVHDGQEFMYVLEGKIKLTLDGRDFILKKGNAAYWNGNVRHRGVSVGKKPAKSLHVHLIPGRWTGTFEHNELPLKGRRRTHKKLLDLE